VTAAAILDSLSPNYAWAIQVPKDDPRIKTETAEYDSPKGGGKIKGLLAQPAGPAAPSAACVLECAAAAALWDHAPPRGQWGNA